MCEDEAGWQANLQSVEHDDYVKSLPNDVWASPPALTKLRRFEE
jgi:hypothetical protein